MRVILDSHKNSYGQIPLLEKERPMTKSEREFIQKSIDINDQKKIFKKIYIIYLILVLIVSTFVFFMYSIKEAIIAFIIMHLIIVLIVLYGRYPLVKLLRQEVIYVREGIFITTNKYHQAQIMINKSDKRETLFIHASSRDSKPICRGDKVIIVKVRGYAYIYQPR